MTKEEDQAFSEANSMGEELCGDCKHYKVNDYTDKEDLYDEGICDIDDSIVCEFMICRLNPSRFEPNRGSPLGETKHAKEEEE